MGRHGGGVVDGNSSSPRGRDCCELASIVRRLVCVDVVCVCLCDDRIVEANRSDTLVTQPSRRHKRAKLTRVTVKQPPTLPPKQVARHAADIFGRKGVEG